MDEERSFDANSYRAWIQVMLEKWRIYVETVALPNPPVVRVRGCVAASFPAHWCSSPDLALRRANQLSYGHGRQSLTQGHHGVQHLHQGDLRRWSCKQPRVAVRIRGKDGLCTRG